MVMEFKATLMQKPWVESVSFLQLIDPNHLAAEHLVIVQVEGVSDLSLKCVIGVFSSWLTLAYAFLTSFPISLFLRLALVYLFH